MKKTSLYIEPEVDAALTRQATARGISKAQLIRESLSATAAAAPRARLSGIGVLHGAPADLAENLDHYLAETGFGLD